MTAETARAPAPRSEPPPDAFETFYAESVDRVYRALAVTLVDVALAREATDEAMTRAYLHWSKVSRLNNPGGWVFRVGLNWATSWRRKLRRERPLADDFPRPAAAHHDTADAAVTEALTALPVQQRAVVVCRVLLDLSTVDTATVLGLPEGTVRSRLSRALAALRADLTRPEEDR
ncbi:putative alternative RNA polymerase sigma factor SigM [Virgisporangium aliadipatigenens]|uniref:Putative alternative RNA polymerase sigma factor SigM n=1 Tax=Virgisporangium aliadipatigenens TaxID=741659 RepID=A0A8J3YK30_9ACTN|nr:sigma-70 family RNA polymerase sigma factor [Virgisporangium aliadipatigenens]GIJ46789.1 putative alternative RNA polymerase sigma factor SigM [Virgisporangium aliadipatigenens]